MPALLHVTRSWFLKLRGLFFRPRPPRFSSVPSSRALPDLSTLKSELTVHSRDTTERLLAIQTWPFESRTNTRGTPLNLPAITSASPLVGCSCVGDSSHAQPRSKVPLLPLSTQSNSQLRPFSPLSALFRPSQRINFLPTTCVTFTSFSVGSCSQRWLS